MENNGDNTDVSDCSNDDGYDAMLDAMVYSFCHVIDYFLKHIYKEPCMTSYMSGEKWVNELLHGHEKRCFNMFRMNQCTFQQLCMELENKYGLQPSDRMSIWRKWVYLYIFLVKVRQIEMHKSVSNILAKRLVGFSEKFWMQWMTFVRICWNLEILNLRTFH